MLSLTPVIARLRERCPQLRYVAGAVEFATVAKAIPTHPAAFVVPLGDTAQGNPYAGGALMQEVASVFGVLLVVGDASDSRGEAAVDTVAALRVDVRAALLAWTPSPEVVEPIEYIGGRLADYAQALVWWQEEFACVYRLRALPGQ